MFKCILFVCCIGTLSLQAQDTTHLTLLFSTNSSTLSEHDVQQLDHFLSTRQHVADCSFTISGHCDSIGSTAYNQQLGKLRAQVVADYLVSGGEISMENIAVLSYGSAQPFADNTTAAGRKLNRRVEIQVVQKPKPRQPITSEQTVKALLPDQTLRILPEFSLNEHLVLSEVLDTLAVGRHLILRDINFPLSTDSLVPEVFPILDTLAAILLRHPTMQVRFEGHICCGNAEGRIAGYPDAKNLRNNRYSLSTDRAIAVFSYLRLKGVPGSQMTYVGMSGKNKLIYPEITEADQIRNRRVEIVILSK